ncbi:MAG TPA: hypothetical protein VM692_13900 [Gammaproteobacteria bacterium]|nr:hypothetical protein [Gammaproteobacteria bacterium]
MRLTTIISSGLIMGIAGSALACDLPKLAVIPPKDQVAGKEAAIRASANAYFTAMQAYTACIQSELSAAGGDSAPDVLKRVLVSRNNTAVAEAEFMMKLFTDNVGPADVPAPAAAPPASGR